MQRNIVIFAITVCLGALFLLGLGRLGEHLRSELAPQEPFTYAFADIECAVPPHQEKADFLDEVRYTPNLPDRLPLLDKELPTKLASAFAQHPWVEKVEHVSVQSPARVQVKLKFRVPTLALDYQGQTRALDATGVLLPLRAPHKHLPKFVGQVRAPLENRAGKPWGDPKLEAACRTLAFVTQQQESLRCEKVSVTEQGEIELHLPTGKRLVWGSAPGEEAPTELSADTKLRKLQRLWAERPHTGSRAEGLVKKP